MAGLATKGKGSAEEEKFRSYLKQLKEECTLRLFGILYNPQYGTMDLKFWLGFAKRKFLKMSMWERVKKSNYLSRFNLSLI